MYSEVKIFLKAQQDVINNYKSITCGNKTIVLSENHLIYAKQTYNDRFTPMLVFNLQYKNDIVYHFMNIIKTNWKISDICDKIRAKFFP